MKKEIEMQLTTILNIFNKHAHAEYVGVYIESLESGTLSIPEMIFALKKLIEYCEQNAGWGSEQKEIIELIEKIRFEVQREDAKLKEEAPVNRFWTAFREWMFAELHSADLLCTQYIEYDNWNGGTYYLNLDFDSLCRMYFPEFKNGLKQGKQVKVRKESCTVFCSVGMKFGKYNFLHACEKKVRLYKMNIFDELSTVFLFCASTGAGIYFVNASQSSASTRRSRSGHSSFCGFVLASKYAKLPHPVLSAQDGATSFLYTPFLISTYINHRGAWPYRINIASPKLKKRYLSSTAVL